MFNKMLLAISFLTSSIIISTDVVLDITPGTPDTCANPQLKLKKALSSKDVDAARRAIELGADVNFRKPQRMTALAKACSKNDEEMVKYLLTVPNIDVNRGDMLGFTPLMFACFNGHTNIVKILLDMQEVDVNATSAFIDWTALTCTGMSKTPKRKEVIDLLFTRKDIRIKGAVSQLFELNFSAAAYIVAKKYKKPIAITATSTTTDALGVLLALYNS